MTESQPVQSYQRGRNFFLIFNLVFDAFLLMGLVISDVSFLIRDFSCLITAQPFMQRLCFFLILGIAFYIIHLPISAFSGWYWERKFNLSKQTFVQWLIDYTKRNVFGFVLLIVLAEGLQLCLVMFSDHWWIAFGCFWLGLTFVLAKLTPVVIVPLFYKYIPVDNEDLRASVLRLFESCNVTLKDVYAVNFSKKTRKANAFVCGVGRGRRVVLSDTLIEKFTVPEVEAVVAHEIGHYKHKDMLSLLCLNSVVTFLGLGFTHLYFSHYVQQFPMYTFNDVAFFPLLALCMMIFGIVTLPVLNGFSRWVERRADLFCLECTQRPEDFISLMKKIASTNFASLVPHPFMEWFFHDHPSIQKRIKFAETFSRMNS